MELGIEYRRELEVSKGRVPGIQSQRRDQERRLQGGLPFPPLAHPRGGIQLQPTGFQLVSFRVRQEHLPLNGHGIDVTLLYPPASENAGGPTDQLLMMRTASSI